MDCWRGSRVDGTDPCVVHHSASTAIWAVFGTIWAFATLCCLNAMRLVRRNKSTQQRVEPRVLSNLLVCSTSFSVLGFYKCVHPANTAIGIDAVSTTLFGIGSATLFVFILFSPLNPSGTGITSFALKRRRTMHKCYRVAFPLLVIVTTAVSFVPFIGMIDRLYIGSAVSAVFAVFGVCVAVICTVDIFSVQKLRRDFRTAMIAKRHEMNDSQRKGVDIIVASTWKTDFVMALCALTTAVICSIVAAGVESARESCWVLLPLLLSIGCGWVLRYTLFSRRVSLRVFRRYSRHSELPTSTRGRMSFFNDKSDSMSSSQMMLTLSPYSMRKNRKQSDPSKNSPTVMMRKEPKPQKSPRHGKRFTKYALAVRHTRPLTRVDEVENEGTVVSKAEPLEAVGNSSSAGSKGEKA